MHVKDLFGGYGDVKYGGAPLILLGHADTNDIMPTKMINPRNKMLEIYFNIPLKVKSDRRRYYISSILISPLQILFLIYYINLLTNKLCHQFIQNR
jgi:hypothetical protein